MLDQLNNILESAPANALYIAVPRKFLVDMRCYVAEHHSRTPVQRIAELHCSKIEDRLFNELYRNLDTIVSTDDLIAASGTENKRSLWVNMRRLRAKVAKILPGLQINTVRSAGYVMREVDG